MLYSGNIVRIILWILLIFSMASPVLAETPDAVKPSAGIQAERGAKNILLGWTDIPRSIIKAFTQTVSGIVDIVTLPVANCDKKTVKPDELNTQIR